MVRRHLPALVLAGIASVAASSPVLAQQLRVHDAATPHPLSEYSGVAPGRPNTPPAAARATTHRRGRGRRAATQVVTWPGFQMLPGGGSRFFIQTTGAVTTTVRQSEGRVEVVFPNAAIHLSNSGRWLETQYFETPVSRARLERRGHDLVFVLFMRAQAAPQVSSGSDGGYSYTYIDFAAGHYVPQALRDSEPAPAPQRETTASGSASVRPASPQSERSYPSDEEMRAMDDERPPPARTGPNP